MHPHTIWGSFVRRAGLGAALAGLLLACGAAGVRPRAAALALPAGDLRVGGEPGVAVLHAVVDFSDLAEPAGDAAETPWAPEWLPLPAGLVPPGGGGAVGGAIGAVRAPTAPDANDAPAPDAASSFTALGDNNSVIPPDTHGAASPTHLLVVLNSQVRMQLRDGTALNTLTLNQFFSSVGGGSGAFDPKAVFDPYGQRFIVVACDERRSAGSALLVGVSQTADPTGAWHFYRLDADPADQAWADFPSLGFNGRWVTIQANLFKNDNSGYSHAGFWALDRAALYAGGPGAFTAFGVAGIGGTIVPALTYDPGLDVHYLAQNWNGDFLGLGYLRLYALSGPVGAEVLSDVGLVVSPEPWADVKLGGAALGPQLGSPHNIVVNDARMQSVVYRDGALWAAQTVLLPAADPTRSGVQWWQLSAGGAVLQRGRLDDPGGQASYAYPSLAVNRDGDMLIGFSRFSPTEYASAYYAFRAAADPPGTLRPERLLKAGEAPYYKTFGITTNRWGDYSATQVDPADDLSFWTIQEYAAAPVGGSDQWGTWWGHVAPPNTAPTLAALDDLVIHEDEQAGPVALTVGDAESAAQHLAVSVEASNPALVPAGGAALSGSGAERTLTLTPLPDQSGAATVTVTVSDGRLSASRTFALTVLPVDDPPAITTPPTVYLNNDGAPAEVLVAVSDVDTPVGALALSAATSDETVVPAAGLVFAGSGAERSLALSAAPLAEGGATITVTVADAAHSASAAFEARAGVLADLSVTKSDGRDEAQPGEALVYTIVVRNAGPNAVSGAVVADRMPDGLLPANWQCLAPGIVCAQPEAGDLETALDLPAGSVVTYTVNAVIASAGGLNVVNTVTVGAPAGILDPPENNTAADVTRVGHGLYLPFIVKL
jgi:uncharacterized repeat protein (TIGR01451 family)